MSSHGPVSVVTCCINGPVNKVKSAGTVEIVQQNPNWSSNVSPGRPPPNCCKVVYSTFEVPLHRLLQQAVIL